VRKFLIESYGCQMNVHDAERLAGLLERSGYAATDSPAEADLVVVNTCSVRDKAEDKLFHRLDELRHERKPSRVVAVTGCVAQQEGDKIAERARDVNVIVGTQAMKQLPALAAAAFAQPGFVRVDVNPYEDVSFPLGVVRRGDPVKAYVTIIEGCNDFCAFCVVPYTRGHERMRPVREVLAEVEQAAATGHREVQLLGQIVNHYQAPDDMGCDFPELLSRVHAVPGIERIRFASPHPRHVTDRLIDAMAALPKVARHLHLPVQSGSTRMLASMRRRHTREDYLSLVDQLRARVPGIRLSTDLIIGFPGETDADFEATLSLVDLVRFHSIFSFKYSTRPNTLASRRLPDDVPEPEKTRRIVAVQARQKDIQLDLHRELFGRDVEILVDGESRRGDELSGRTSGNTVVNVAGPREWIGRFATVRVVRTGANSLSGVATAVEGVGAAAVAEWANRESLNGGPSDAD
jgi:tRNA-2-methylthio-N6-dimethylallyladenosine synthase